MTRMEYVEQRKDAIAQQFGGLIAMVDFLDKGCKDEQNKKAVQVIQKHLTSVWKQFKKIHSTREEHVAEMSLKELMENMPHR
jgi:hypothetical protein